MEEELIVLETEEQLITPESVGGKIAPKAEIKEETLFISAREINDE